MALEAPQGGESHQDEGEWQGKKREGVRSAFLPLPNTQNRCQEGPLIPLAGQ